MTTNTDYASKGEKVHLASFWSPKLKMTEFAFAFLVFAIAECAHADQRIPAEVTAVSSDTFLSSLGVNTHIDQGYDPGSYALPLRYLGVRNVRDGVRNLSGHLMLHAQTGIRFDLLGADVRTLIAAA